MPQSLSIQRLRQRLAGTEVSKIYSLRTGLHEHFPIDEHGKLVFEAQANAPKP